MNIQKAFRALLLMAACVFSISTKAQNVSKYYTDTVRVTLAEVEQRFVDKSLALIIAKYDVDIAKAGVTQAKLWYNPNIYFSHTLYNNTTEKWFDGNAPSGNYDIQINQLFSIAGKHTNAVKLAKIDAQRAEYNFKEILRSLKLELYTNFITLYTDELKINIYNSQVANLKRLISAAEQQKNLGTISGNELIRLRAEMNELENLSLGIENDLFNSQAEMKSLLGYDLPVFILASGDLPSNLALPPLADVLNTAIQNRSDVMLAEKDIDFAKTNLYYQRSVAVPDLNVGTEFDRAGNASPYFYGLNVGMPLPLFNRNQGQIAIAKFQLKRAEDNHNYTMNLMQNQVESNYFKLVNIKDQLNNLDTKYSDDLENLIKFAVQNYNKRYINLLEFLDQLRTYTSAKLSLIDLRSTYFSAIQNLNYNIGTDLLK